MHGKTMLAAALKPLYTETGSKIATQDEWWANEFYDYCHTPGNEGISNSYASKYRSGARIITAKYTRYYSSSASLRIPPRLVTDLERHLGRYATSTQLITIYNGMIGYCQRQDAYDRARLMPDALADNPDLTTTATLCAAVIWHAMCYDLAHAA